MVTAEDVLERHFAGMSPAELDRRLATVPEAGASPLSEGARDYLATHGGPEAAEALGDLDPAAIRRERAIVAAQSLSEVVANSVTMDEAARLLGVSRSRVSHRIAAGALYGVTVGHRRRIPRWQITDDGSVIAGLADIVPAIPAAVHPLALQSFMTSTQPELGGLSPVAYVQSGGSPQVVADWVADLGR